MKFNNAELEKEFKRYIQENPDIEGQRHPLINISDTFRAYFALADYFTDPSLKGGEKMLIGIRSTDLLYSALSRQTTSFMGKQKYTSAIDICSTLFYGMVKNHSFSDGNKRTALLILIYQLDLYKYYPSVSEKEFEKLVVSVAAGRLKDDYQNVWKKYRKFDDCEIKTIAHLLRHMTTKKDHSYHIEISSKDLVSALEKNGVECSQENGKLRFKRVISSAFLWPKKTKTYAINFGGWTRCIGAATLRDVLEALDLYDEFPNYQTFLEGGESLYGYISKFEGPLRRLKDE